MISKSTAAFVTLVFLFGIAGVVVAADAPAAKTSESSEPWSGIYLGAHFGYGWGGAKWNNIVANAGTVEDFAPGSSITSHDAEGLMGGGQVGLNYQRGPWVFGIESAYSGSNIDGDSRSRIVPKDDIYTTRITRIFLATARAGYSWKSWLAYLRAGYTFGNVTTEFVDATGPVQGRGRTDELHHGFAVGPGIEYMVVPNVVVGTEYNYINLGSTDHKLGIKGNVSGFLKNRVNPDDIHNLTVRLSFLFNPGW